MITNFCWPVPQRCKGLSPISAQSFGDKKSQSTEQSINQWIDQEAPLKNDRCKDNGEAVGASFQTKIATNNLKQI